MFGLEKGCCNPYLNNVAQVVESVQVVERRLQLIDEIADHRDPARAARRSRPGPANGAGCVEAPRGILFHRTSSTTKGAAWRPTSASPPTRTTPTSRRTSRPWCPRSSTEDQDEIRLLMEMLVRSYDPCISCSTHYLDVEFV